MRTWTPTGVASSLSGDPSFDTLLVKQITTYLSSKGVKVTPDFFEDIYTAVAVFYSAREMYQKSKPGAVRENIALSLDRTQRLNQSINHLDGNSRKLLNGQVGVIYAHIREINNILQEAKVKANEYPKHGRLKDFPLETLISDIGEALKELGVKLTVYKSGMFHEVVILVVQEVTGKAVEDLHTQLERAIANPNPTVKAP